MFYDGLIKPQVFNNECWSSTYQSFGFGPWGPRSHMWSRSCRATRPLDRSFLQRKLTTSPSPEAIRNPQISPGCCSLGWYHSSIRMEDYWRSTPLVHQAWFIHPGSTLIITLTLVEVFETACFQHVSRMVEKRLK